MSAPAPHQTGVTAPDCTTSRPAANHKPANLLVSARGISKHYEIGGQRRAVLSHVDFSVRPGETVFLAGPSGSGKTTLLSILGLLLTPDSGELQLGGHRVEQSSEVERTIIRREMIGFVFQKFQLIDGLNAEDNVAIPLAMEGIPLSQARRKASELLERVGLIDHRHALPGSMSPGQCQRVAIARAVIGKPQLILADEPTAALDGHTGNAVIQLMRELTDELQSSMVVVTHDNRIHQYADRICEIENGALI